MEFLLCCSLPSEGELEISPHFEIKGLAVLKGYIGYFICVLRQKHVELFIILNKNSNSLEFSLGLYESPNSRRLKVANLVEILHQNEEFTSSSY